MPGWSVFAKKGKQEFPQAGWMWSISGKWGRGGGGVPVLYDLRATLISSDDGAGFADRKQLYMAYHFLNHEHMFSG
jgi:hypothetical protein